MIRECYRVLRFSTGPEKKGIETEDAAEGPGFLLGSRLALKKKGWRRPIALAGAGIEGFITGPEEKGIETVFGTRAVQGSRSALALKKKGLRLHLWTGCLHTGPFSTGPEEKGIETD